MVGESESLSYDASTFRRFDNDSYGSPLENIKICAVVNQIDNLPTPDWILQRVIDRNEKRKEDRYKLYLELKREFEGIDPE